MKHVVLKGCHYSTFFPWIYKLKTARSFNYKITFTDSCRYEIDEASCVNKLFGFCFGLFGVHWNSARFGWAYDKYTDTIRIWSYCYVNGKLRKFVVDNVPIGKEVDFSMVVFGDDNKQKVQLYLNNNWVDSRWFNENHNYLLSLGLYFGGNTRAPHNIYVNYKKQ